MSRWPVRISQTGSGPTPPGDSQDRFAPKYLVGNVPAGDSAVAYSTNGFVYVPDTGDGAGIALALSYADPTSLAFVASGDVWIRPGTYNFGTGAVAMPLTIPAGTRVQGAGNTTVLKARAAGDQGVFVLAAGGAPPTDSAFASLRDVLIQVPQTTDTTGATSVAAVLVQAGGVAITGVNLSITTSGVSVLRHGILVDTQGANVLPQISVDTTSIEATVIDYAETPVLTSCIRISEGQVAARNVTLIGGDIGVEITNNNTDVDPQPGGAVFFGNQLLIANPSQYAVLSQQAANAANAAAMRISDSIFSKDFAAVPPLGAGTSVGAALGASFVSTFRSVVIIGFSTGYDVRPVNLSDTASVQVDDCGIFLCDLGVRFGAGAVGCSVSDTEIGSALPFPPSPISISANRGILIESAGVPTTPPQSISVTNNTIRVSDWTGAGATTYGVWCDAAADNVFIEGNEIEHLAGGVTIASVYVFDSVDVVVADNHITTQSSVGGIVVADSTGGATSRRTTVTGNTLLMPSGLVPPVGIDVVAAKQVTITGNTIDHSAYAVANAAASAIRVVLVGQEGPEPTRCTVTGNSIRPSSALGVRAISLNASENTCANNVCSLDVPPATPAIAVAGDNNIVLGNVCLTVPPVDNTGAGNEVAHNI